MGQDYASRLDSARWSGVHWPIFLSSSLGFFVWGFVYALSSLVASWSTIPAGGAELVLMLSYLALPVGNLALGWLADRVGRKNTFVVTLSLYAVGLAGVVLSPGFVPLLVSLALAQAGAGGEEPASLSSLAEYSPVRHRGKALILSSNFVNLGALAAAVLGAYGSGSIAEQKLMFGVGAAVLLLTVAVARKKMRESVRWLAQRGRTVEADSIARSLDGQKDAAEAVSGPPKRYSRPFSFIILALLGASQLMTYGLLSFVVGPYYYPSLTPQIIIVANGGAFVAGLAAALLVDRVRRKSFTVLSYVGGLATVALLLPTAGYVGGIMPLFFVFLFANMVFSEYAWASRVTLEPELAGKTGGRATFVGTVRLAAWIPFVVSISATAAFTLPQFLTLNIVLWGVGAVAAAAWYLGGVETSRRSLEEIEAGSDKK
ncbi:MAG: MFS transporter [Nitrososphaerota archaeon]|nr:MFS transporter [Nitrososphaerota archaeon]MDG6938949.1 MFS transporter [Nitrososphaerota archaeon]